MSGSQYRTVLLVSGLLTTLLWTGCSGGGSAPAPPKPGSIGHAWASAGEAYKKGDYARAMDHLSRVAANQNEYREKASLWLIVVSAGVADGYLELAGAYDIGSKINKTMASDYRRRMTESRNAGSTVALRFAETIHEYMEKNKDPKLALDFPFPTGSAAEPMQLAKVNKGFTIQTADNEVLRDAVLQRNVVKIAAAIGGAPDDPAKAQAGFANPQKNAFFMAVAQALHRQSDIFTQRKLDVHKKGRALCSEALEALAYVADSKEKKALETKIKEDMKKFKVES